LDPLSVPELRSAIEVSHLRSLSGEALVALCDGASTMRVRAGAIYRREGDTSPHFDLVVAGLLRMYVAAPGDRTMTVRYCRKGALVGAVSLFAGSFLLPVTAQALTETDILCLRVAVVSEAAHTDPKVAVALMRELSERVLSFIVEIPGALASVRQRVARHLLDLASERRTGSELVASIGQQELADAVGTAREVVVRALRALREEGLIRTGRQGIVLVQPDRLAEELATRPTLVTPHDWNSSS